MVLVPSHKIVDANANKPGIIDLFKSHSLGLIGLEDAKDDQDILATKPSLGRSEPITDES